jgi:phosphohistidine phosphatase SixA
MPPLRRTLLAATAVLSLLTLGTAGARAQTQELRARLSGVALIESLREGGKVILMRHMTTAPGKDDPEVLDLEDCATQRNLNELGREQAAAIGEAVEKLAIPVSQVLSSPYCRCLETGTIAFGEVEKSELLGSGADLAPKEKISGGEQVRRLLDTKPADGGNTVLITHTVNLLYTFGLEPKPEGIAHVFQPTGLGIATYLGTIVPDDWVQAVKNQEASR